LDGDFLTLDDGCYAGAPGNERVLYLILHGPDISRPDRLRATISGQGRKTLSDADADEPAAAA
jgi:hypothetical protein